MKKSMNDGFRNAPGVFNICVSECDDAITLARLQGVRWSFEMRVFHINPAVSYRSLAVVVLLTIERRQPLSGLIRRWTARTMGINV